MSWLTSLPDPIRMSTEYLTEYQWKGYFLNGVFYVTGQESRTRTIYTNKYPAMDQTTADAAASTFNGQTNVVASKSVRQNKADGYAVFVTCDVKGTWS